MVNMRIKGVCVGDCVNATVEGCLYSSITLYNGECCNYHPSSKKEVNYLLPEDLAKFGEAYSAVEKGIAKKLEVELSKAKVIIYQCGTVIRADFKIR